MPNNHNLAFLYYFTCDSIDILEVKITGLPEGTPLDRIYHWLYYNKKTQQIQKLHFKSMRSENNQEYRQFQQGDLQFDTSCAHLQLHTDTSTQTFDLVVQKTNVIPDSLIAQVQSFLTHPEPRI